MKKLFAYLLIYLFATCGLLGQTIDKTVELGYEAFTINSTANASGEGDIEYRWLENGSPISGATTVDYEVPAGKGNGVYTFIRQSKTSTCTDWQNSNAYTVQVGVAGVNTVRMGSCGQVLYAPFVLFDGKIWSKNGAVAECHVKSLDLCKQFAPPYGTVNEWNSNSIYGHVEARDDMCFQPFLWNNGTDSGWRMNFIVNEVVN